MPPPPPQKKTQLEGFKVGKELAKNIYKNSKVLGKIIPCVILYQMMQISFFI
jgi:hypothetical protein